MFDVLQGYDGEGLRDYAYGDCVEDYGIEV
jgi:hypothetical protein